MSEYSFSVEYVHGSSNESPDWLSRNFLDEIYYYQDHRMSDVKAIEILHRENWKKFVSTQDRRSLLFSWYTRFYRGYAHMLKGAEDKNVTWPNISEDIREYLRGCSYAISK
jgi:hypothetical protein